MTLSNRVFSLLILTIVGCSSPDRQYESFGKSITDKDALKINILSDHQFDESTPIKLTATVDQVCQAKGCWMTLKNENGKAVRVTFKDYGFFVPKDISNQEVIVEGFVTEKILEPEVARHYAEDANQEFDSTKEYLEYSLIADGVLIAAE